MRRLCKRGSEVLATFRQRFPSRRDVLLLFAACVFPIHIWSIINLLYELPAWMLRSDLWDVAGMVAYTLAFALFESMCVLLVLLLICFVLPRRFPRDRVLALGSMVVFVTSVWAIGIHYRIVDSLAPAQAQAGWLLWLAVYLAVMGIAGLFIYRDSRLRRWIESFVERLAVLSFLYVLVDFICVIILVLRNI